MILAGDIGGTHCRFLACDEEGRPLAQQVYASRAYSRFTDAVNEFIAPLHKAMAKKPAVACFGLPGPVISNRCRLTNLSWLVDGEELGSETGIGQVFLLNDLAANAYGLETLKPDELLTIQAGEPCPYGNVVVIAPGTGLGEAGLVYSDTHPVAVATEGGHGDFAPTNDLEIELLRYAQRRFKSVTYETFISGPGLEHIYDFLLERSGQPTPDALAQLMAKGDRSAAISEAALSHSDPTCEKALDMFVEILGSEASNLALKFLAVGGVYLGGGIPPKIRQKFFEPGFLRRFKQKDRMEWLLPRIPIRLVLNDRAALQGATAHALRKLRSLGSAVK